jgi:hypothetical protein
MSAADSSLTIKSGNAPLGLPRERSEKQGPIWKPAIDFVLNYPTVRTKAVMANTQNVNTQGGKSAKGKGIPLGLKLNHLDLANLEAPQAFKAVSQSSLSRDRLQSDSLTLTNDDLIL